MPTPLTMDAVLARSDDLPAFPRAIEQILTTLDDPDATLDMLVAHVEHDPIIAGHVLSIANRAGAGRHNGAAVSDVFTAVSLIGLSCLRETVIMTSLAGFLHDMTPMGQLGNFWERSIAVGICSMQLARRTAGSVGIDSALVAGLLHDVGQLWLLRFESKKFNQAGSDAMGQKVDCTLTERAQFGVDHAEIGAWLAQSWGLPAAIVLAIAQHHNPDPELTEPLVAVVHVAEVLSNALDLSHDPHGRVVTLSNASCALLALDWGDDSHQLFGQMEACWHHAARVFSNTAAAPTSARKALPNASYSDS